MTTEEIAALPNADVEQQHLVAELADPVFVDAATHGFAEECGEQCACGDGGR